MNLSCAFPLLPKKKTKLWSQWIDSCNCLVICSILASLQCDKLMKYGSMRGVWKVPSMMCPHSIFIEVGIGQELCKRWFLNRVYKLGKLPDGPRFF